ncbi:hypothetical protein QQ045_030982 [Rhodiola kirilowii]
MNDSAQSTFKPIVSTSVRDLLECPVCLNSMYPPIHQCQNGHTLCSGCKPRVHNRALGALESILTTANLHESQCIHRPYSCPYSGSEYSVVGDVPYLVAHLKDDHKVDKHNDSTFNHRYVKSKPHEVENATWMLTVFSCFGQYFSLHFEAFQLGVAPVYVAFL